MGDPVIDQEIRMLDGDTFRLDVYRGLGMLITNLGSRGRYADQVPALDALNAKLGPSGLLVLGVPSNDFRGEPGMESAVRIRYTIELQVGFPVTAPMHVSGERCHGLFRALTAKSRVPVRSDLEKFVVDGDGYVIERFGPDVPFGDPKVMAALKFVLPTISY